jgi:hypothetical protein
MPCYEVRTVSVEFKVGNIDLLKKALADISYRIQVEGRDSSLLVHDRMGRRMVIDLDNSTIKSASMNEKELAAATNQIKRAYSEQVIDEVAKRQKWMKKKLGDNRYQLQRF